MKKFLLLTFIGSIFALGSAYAHCGSCGAGDEAHDHAKKACCSEVEGECCKKKSECKSEECKKACEAKEKAEKAADETAAAKTGACCPAKKAGNPA